MAEIIVKYPSANLYPATTGLYPTKPEALWIFAKYSDKLTISGNYAEAKSIGVNREVKTKGQYPEPTTLNGKRPTYKGTRS